MTDVIKMKENWPVIKGKMRQKFGILTDSDLVWVDGKYDQLLGKLNLILGVSKEDLDKFISEA
ncbi:general stress protein CsbD [Aurantibacillus circumpalustris]|uniref:general stress protein CsbD n=1 Tax=Aurantibacillus circumpalustris TaxID=3036359 RepID=UPI00295B2967|nr:general stress protein CsbD [Aurantibacillus circumpalustris]